MVILLINLVNIIILNKKDIVSIMNVYIAKMNGLRKYKKLITDDMKKIEMK